MRNEIRSDLAEHTFRLSKSDGSLTQSARSKWPKTRGDSCLTGVYVLLYDNKVIRIGESATGLRRVKRGFTQPLRSRRTQKKNYYAYHFRRQYRGKRLVVRFYTSPSVGLADSACRRRIEAELAYRCRRDSENERWPEAMTEIHFGNDLRPEELSFVAHIEADSRAAGGRAIGSNASPRWVAPPVPRTLFPTAT